MPTKFFNRYDIKIPIVCINKQNGHTYTCTAMPRTEGEVLEGYEIGETTKSSYPKLLIVPEIVSQEEVVPKEVK